MLGLQVVDSRLIGCVYAIVSPTIGRQMTKPIDGRDLTIGAHLDKLSAVSKAKAIQACRFGLAKDVSRSGIEFQIHPISSI